MLNPFPEPEIIEQMRDETLTGLDNEAHSKEDEFFEARIRQIDKAHCAIGTLSALVEVSANGGVPLNRMTDELEELQKAMNALWRKFIPNEVVGFAATGSEVVFDVEHQGVIWGQGLVLREAKNEK